MEPLDLLDELVVVECAADGGEIVVLLRGCRMMAKAGAGGGGELFVCVAEDQREESGAQFAPRQGRSLDLIAIQLRDIHAKLLLICPSHPTPLVFVVSGMHL